MTLATEKNAEQAMDAEAQSEQSHVGMIREKLVYLVGWAKICLFGAAGLALFIGALVVVGQGIILFVGSLDGQRYGVGLELLLDRMFIAMMIAEILDTVRLSISSRTPRCQPFLIVGMIAATRQILLVAPKINYPVQTKTKTLDDH